MASICSSPPQHYNYAQGSASPPLTSPRSLPQYRKSSYSSSSSSSRRNPYNCELTAPPLHLPRGHDSSDVAAYSKSLEENATMSSRMAQAAQLQLQQQQAKEPAVISIGEPPIEEERDCTAEDNEPQGPFEGPEKLLELWFADCQTDIPGQGLKSVERTVWEDMLDIVKCKVLSTIEGADVDAYLLSESSMFVFPHKLILKTCGTTTLLLGLERILQIANTALGNIIQTDVASCQDLGKLVKQCFYSRKSFMFPERQKGPHKDWLLEVGLLDRFFDEGSAYTVGKMNGDHWLLYLTSAQSQSQGVMPLQIQRPLRLPAMSRQRALSDQTLEILMTHLSPASCSRFEFPNDMSAPTVNQVSNCSTIDRGHLLGTRLADQLGLSSLFPGTTLDAFAFEPCGFSANAVISGVEGNSKTLEDAYWTVHVTPEHDSSYASFETNVHMDESGRANEKDLPWLIARVLSIFEPSRMSVTLFTSSDNHSENGQGRDDIDDDDDIMPKDVLEPKRNQGDVLHALQLDKYKRTDRIAYEFEDYDLVFVSFDKIGERLPRR